MSRPKEVRVQKIQYRFLKELEERALMPRDMQGAYDMADKIRRYPLEPAHVMTSWEKFTKTAIEDYKAGTGSDGARDSQHRAYAMMFSVVRAAERVKDSAELFARLREVERKNGVQESRSVNAKMVRYGDEMLPGEWVDKEGRFVGPSQQASDVRPRSTSEKTRSEAVTAKELPSQKHARAVVDGEAVRSQERESITEELPARAADRSREARLHERAPQQRTLALPEQTFGPERTTLDVRVERMVEKLRQLTPELRATIESAARDALADGLHTPTSAREALPEALEVLRSQKTPENTVHALTLATIARVPEHAALIAELGAKSVDERREIAGEARMRLERYPALDSGISLVRRDEVGAAVHDVLNPSAEGRRDVLVLAQARDEAERIADPRHGLWERIAADMVSEPG
jgi:hypothetical protein